MTRALLAVAGLCLFITGCATRASVRAVHADVSALRDEVRSLRQLHEQAAHETARTASAIKGLDTRLRELSGSVAEVTAEAGRLKGRVVAVEESIRKAQADSAARPTETAAPSPPPERAPREAPPKPSADEAAFDAFNAAVATFRAREHGQAVLEFLDFLAKYPEHPLAASAQYWIAEAYFVQHDYRQALVEFQKVLEYAATPDGRAPDALLKIGLCYARLRDTGRAQRAWERVIREYPGTEAAIRAQSLLKTRRG